MFMKGRTQIAARLFRRRLRLRTLLRNRSKQSVERRRVPVPVPVAEIDRLKLPEAERWFVRSENYRHEPSVITALRGLVLHPGRLDRGLGPDDHYGIGTLELAVDLGGEA